MIVTVTPNPALDLTWHVASLTVGDTHRADAGQVRAGGKGLNVARVAHAQGADTIAMTTTGGTTGAEFAAELAASGVPHVLVPVEASTRRSVALVDEALGDTTVVNERGIAPSDAEWQTLRDAVSRALRADGAAGAPAPGASAVPAPGAPAVPAPGAPADDAPAPGAPAVPAPAPGAPADGDERGADTPDVGRIPRERPISGVSAPDPDAPDPDAPDPDAPDSDAVDSGAVDAPAAGAARVLVISGSLPPGIPDDALPDLIRLGREAGVRVIVDTSGPALLAAADAGASVLKPNEHELRDATGLDDPVDGARELIRRGARLVLLSLGADGMLAITPTASGDVSVLHARLGAALGGNPTGAGDAAVAACAVLMDAGIHDPAQILRRATAWSAAAVLMPLAGEIHPSWPELESALTITALTITARPAGPAADPPHHPEETR
ncbi:1-phosphofructokinase family hexose kinase [Microbacterium sp. nov. GSS16]|uniref:1-phosphofructokinase family hexose kinase n=1 Tax=Microbacterium sp. nov. GSS16 TaxID=3019890 RepID=UPI0023062932|nr:PfkB family carbohydrate kinase [Microbacterium sp. nov. GSS16]WCD93363.1 PfkB family carbohydrate kinase [Microbacterium sp. nov. GSS16]